MKVIVDADSCSHRKFIQEECRKRDIPLHFFCDATHDLNVSYGEVHKVDISPESADCAALSFCKDGDIMVTSDYGVVSIALAKGAECISSGGHVYTDAEILGRLTSKHLNNIMRRRKDYKAIKSLKNSRKKEVWQEDFREQFILMISRKITSDMTKAGGA